MRVRAVHISDFAAPYPGAFIRQLRMLDEELRRRGAGRCVLAFPQRAEGRPWLDELRRDGFEICLLPEPQSRTVRSVARAIEGLVSDVQPDVVHTHFGTYDLSTAAALRRFGRTHGSAVCPAQVWHYRTALETPLDERSLVRRVKDLYKFRIVGGRADRVIGVTEAMAREVANRGVGDSALAVVAGCDTETFRAPTEQRRRELRARLGVSDDDVLLLHMGWHWYRKGGDLLAAAARLLAERGHTNIVTRSIGAPLDELEAPVARVEPTDSVFELHQASDIFVSASRSEGFGNGLVEALACERVAVAAVAAGQRELFERLGGCRPVPVGDAVALADGIEWLLEHRKDWPRLGAANRAHVVEHNSMRGWARELADVYAELRPLAPASDLTGSSRQSA